MHQRRSRSLWMWIVGFCLVAPTLYFLSLGPVHYWMMHMGEDPSELAVDVVDAVYTPVSYLYELPLIGTALDRYLALWVEPEYEWAGPVTTGAISGGSTGTATGVVLASSVEGDSEDAEARGAIDESEPAVTPAHAVTAGPPPTVRRSYEITVPPAGSRPTEVPPVLIAEGDRQQLAMQTDGANPKLTANLLYLSGNVRISAPDGKIVVESERASISHRFVEGSRTEFRDVGVELVGKVQWKGAGLEATADRLYLTLVPPGPDEGPLPEISKLELWGPVQLTASQTTGKADSAEFEFDPKTGLSADLPTRIILKRNASLSLPGTSGAKGSIEADRIEYFPRTDEVKVDPDETPR